MKNKRKKMKPGTRFTSCFSVMSHSLLNSQFSSTTSAGKPQNYIIYNVNQAIKKSTMSLIIEINFFQWDTHSTIINNNLSNILE